MGFEARPDSGLSGFDEKLNFRGEVYELEW
jgi:hypothetical protein